ncbi:TetR/AcrR family transcriptional regulator [Nocardia alni]|uniref:TetR/AcrR family transcriptional regulator n=1 Tax=Nocardia alni TaxID=2815723 RepID=UPI001C226100|nr:TetR/AcrR family transcriptional regulator [Nocardia alni]
MPGQPATDKTTAPENQTARGPANGRSNQKERTRRAILDAAGTLIDSGEEATMPAVARAARVSEATAYRYFPDLPSLLREAMQESWPGAAYVMAPIADVTDPADRVAHATEVLLRHTHAHTPAVRATIAAAFARPAEAIRPAYRLGLIDAALAPLTPPANPTEAPGPDSHTVAKLTPTSLTQLRQDLAVIMSAEAFFTLTDLCGLSPEDAITSVVSLARSITTARLT